ncbi:hypothetical protein DFH08DRAFT_901350 [Mycena albidolilacea]|uniref:Uncharacterized protein n=1 Tax=Mycena albidolilacea TaxID=1033008 RepID=A0AAD7EA75_9AGAR|nr:hypothetical protein DFH08DRAFT_901350 [Mycena albidolilacea]
MPARQAWTYTVHTDLVGHRYRVTILIEHAIVLQRSRRAIVSAPPYQVVESAGPESLDRQVARRSRCPAAPRIPYLTLPGAPTLVLSPIPPVFPVDLSVGISPIQMAYLSDPIPAFTTVAVRTTYGDLLCNVDTGRNNMTSGDLVRFLQHLAHDPMGCHLLGGNVSLTFFAFREDLGCWVAEVEMPRYPSWRRVTPPPTSPPVHNPRRTQGR